MDKQTNLYSINMDFVQVLLKTVRKLNKEKEFVVKNLHKMYIFIMLTIALLANQYLIIYYRDANNLFISMIILKTAIK